MSMSSRRSFLTKLAALVVAPFAVRAAIKSQPKLGSTGYLGSPGLATQGKVRITVKHFVVKVPSNYRITDTGLFHEPRDVWYDGDWDGTFKLTFGCFNPAYILADLMECNGETPNWAALYEWGRYCDEQVIDWERTGPPRTDGPTPTYMKPRYEVRFMCQTQVEVDWLREKLRRDCLNWPGLSAHYRLPRSALDNPL